LRALLKNTHSRVAVALLAIIFAVVGLSACSSGAPGSATALLADTFSGGKQIESAKLDLSFELKGTGHESAGTGTPLSLKLSGPFESRDPGKLPRFALQLDLSSGEHAIRAGATSTGSGLFVDLAGTWFSTPESTYKAIESGFAQATKAVNSSKSKSSFATLGIEPGHWLKNPKKLGTTTIDGAKTIHLASSVNIQAFLADVQKLSASGVFGSSSELAGAGALSSSVLSELAKSIKSAHVDIYTGESDHLLRLLELEAVISATPQTQSALNGLKTADVRLKLEFSDLDKPQSINAPSNPKPASELLPSLQQLLGGLQGAGSLQGLGGSSSSSVR
jgi:hypothetical protein